MRLLADEDFPGPIVTALREAGFDLVRMQDIARGEPDDVVLARAFADGRILLTRDVGFGERVVRDSLQTCGVILLRLRGDRDWPAKIARVLEALNELADQAAGAITTIEWASIRRRALTEE